MTNSNYIFNIPIIIVGINQKPEYRKLGILVFACKGLVETEMNEMTDEVKSADINERQKKAEESIQKKYHKQLS